MPSYLFFCDIELRTHARNRQRKQKQGLPWDRWLIVREEYVLFWTKKYGEKTALSPLLPVGKKSLALKVSTPQDVWGEEDGIFPFLFINMKTILIFILQMSVFSYTEITFPMASDRISVWTRFLLCAIAP